MIATVREIREGYLYVAGFTGQPLDSILDLSLDEMKAIMRGTNDRLGFQRVGQMTGLFGSGKKR